MNLYEAIKNNLTVNDELDNIEDLSDCCGSLERYSYPDKNEYGNLDSDYDIPNVDYLDDFVQDYMSTELYKQYLKAMGDTKDLIQRRDKAIKFLEDAINSLENKSDDYLTAWDNLYNQIVEISEDVKVQTQRILKDGDYLDKTFQRLKEHLTKVVEEDNLPIDLTTLSMSKSGQGHQDHLGVYSEEYKLATKGSAGFGYITLCVYPLSEDTSCRGEPIDFMKDVRNNFNQSSLKECLDTYTTLLSDIKDDKYKVHTRSIFLFHSIKHDSIHENITFDSKGNIINSEID